MTPESPLTKAPIGLDLDGVLCRPPLGVNLTISRRLDLPPLPEKISRPAAGSRWGQHLLWWVVDALRYTGRRPLPGVREELAALADLRTPVIVTARHARTLPLIRRWLERHGLAPFIQAVYANGTGLPSAHFKLLTLRQHRIVEHVDDDGSIVYYLARHGLRRVYLRDWPRNRGLPYPPNVLVVRSLREVADDIRRREGAG